jgi:hypothetical protein
MPKPSPQIEILTVRHPDDATSVEVFVDGVPYSDYAEENVDPGRGHQIDDWLEGQVNALLAGYSPAFRDAAIAAYEQYDSSSYIEGDRDEAVLSCHHAEGQFPDRTYCHWEQPFGDDIYTAAAALRAHRKAAHPEK